MARSSRETLRMIGTLARLIFSIRRNRADLLYATLGRNRLLKDGSSWFNLGYWMPGVLDYAEASRAMADVAADAAGIGAGETVLDAGCGFGEGRREAHARFSELVTLIENALFLPSPWGRPGLLPPAFAGAGAVVGP
jgi:hypothetical protein